MINAPYAIAAIVLMVLIYTFINYYHRDRQGLESIFANAIFQLNRNLQVYLQKSRGKKKQNEWRPSAICISKNSFERDTAFKLLNWISYKYGFGTFLHRIEGYYSKSTYEQAQDELAKLINTFDKLENHVYVDTIISPSYTSAIAQAIQVPGISGMENNMVIFEAKRNDNKDFEEIVENYSLINAGNFDVCIISSSDKKPAYKNGIHVWIKSSDTTNANLMIMLSFIISGHPDWKKGKIQIYEVCKSDQYDEIIAIKEALITEGRLPITEKNIEVIIEEEGVSTKNLIREKSSEAALTLIGFRGENIKHHGSEEFKGFDGMGTILFVNSHDTLQID